MKKLIGLVMLMSFILALTTVAYAADEANPVVRDLQAGNDGTVIGTVTYWNDSDNLHVEFAINDSLAGGGYELLKTQVLATDDSRLKGALATGAPGQFPYEHFPPSDAKFDSFTIPLADLGVEANNTDDLIVAFHANVQNLNDIVGYMDSDGVIHDEAGADCPTLEDIGLALPGQVSLNVSTAGDGYFQSTITGGTSLDGTYTGWCIDAQHYITPGANYDTVNVYSSYEPLPDSVLTAYDQPSQTVVGANSNIDKEENLDLVNWLINNRDGYSDADVQDAIWTLIDDNPYGCSTACQDLVAAAYANGEGFEPNFLEGEVLAVILQAVDSTGGSDAQVTIAQVTIAQVTLIQLGLECTPWTPVYKGDTAWAITEDDGISFPRSNNWGLYYVYTVTIVPAP